MKTAIITGASSGIGRATALLLANTYKRIAITSCHHPDALLSLAEELKALGTDCIVQVGDIGNYEFVHSFVHTVLEEWGHIDVLINNAGQSYIGLLTDMSLTDWNEILHTNLSSVFHCCHAVIPCMVQKKQGRILNVSSVWGQVGASCEVAYSATKGGINAFTQALAKELAPSNIQVNALACGVIDTPMNSCFSTEDLETLSCEIPVGRLATVQEVATMLQQLLNAPDYLTGQIIRFDGGWI